MEWDGRGVGTRSSEQLPILKMREGALDGASGQSRGGGDGLMGQAHRPVRLLRRLSIEIKINDERGQAAVMAHQVGQEAVEYVRVKRYLYHRLV